MGQAVGIEHDLAGQFCILVEGARCSRGQFDAELLEFCSRQGQHVFTVLLIPLLAVVLHMPGLFLLVGIVIRLRVIVLFFLGRQIFQMFIFPLTVVDMSGFGRSSNR